MGSSGNGMFGTYRGGGAGSIVRGEIMEAMNVH